MERDGLVHEKHPAILRRDGFRSPFPGDPAPATDRRGLGFYLGHDRQGSAFRILEERHPFLHAVGMAMDHVGNADELDATLFELCVARWISLTRK